MNNNKKWTKSISVTLLVVLASVVTTGLVLADHFPPMADVAVNSLTSFEQYQAAIDHAERERTAALTAISVSKVNSLDVFTQYSEALEQMERDRTAILTAISASKVNSLNVFTQYSEALEQMERDRNAALIAISAGDTNMRWEQYFKYAR